MGFQKNIQLGKLKKICQKRSLSVDKTSSNAFMGATKRSQARGGSKPPRALDSGGKSGSSGGESGKSFESKNANKFREDLRLDRQFFKQLLNDPMISKSIQREVRENPNKKEIRGQIGIREFLQRQETEVEIDMYRRRIQEIREMGARQTGGEVLAKSKSAHGGAYAGGGE